MTNIILTVQISIVISAIICAIVTSTKTYETKYHKYNLTLIFMILVALLIIINFSILNWIK